MAAIIGSIEVILNSNVDAYNSAMRSASTTTEQHTARMDRAVKATAGSVNSLGRSLGSMNTEAFRSLSYSALHASDGVERLRMSMLAVLSLAGGFAGAFAIKGLVETADTYTNIQNRLRVITDNTQERVALEKELFDSAQRTRTSIEETAKLYSRMDLAIGEHLSKRDKMKFVETVQKSFAVSGMTQSEISSNVLEITHGIDSGRIQAKTLRPLLMENVALGKELARIMAGGDLSKLREMGENGEITSEKFVRAIIQAGSTIDKQFTRVVPTVSSSLTVLNNAWTRYIGMQNESTGASVALSRGIIDLADNMQTLGDHAIQVGTILASLFIGRSVARRTVSGGGAIADSVRGMIDERKADLAAARATALRAQEERAMAIVAAEQASRRTATLRDAPAFMAAAPASRAAWEKQQANVDSIKAAIAAADAKQTAALEKRAALEGTVATASEAALRRQQAANAALAAEKERILLIDQQIAAAEARMNSAGGGVSRKQMGQFYGAWGNVVDQRAAFAATEANLQRAQQIEQRLRTAISGGSDRTRPMFEANLQKNLDAQRKFADEKIAIGRALNRAEQEFAAVQQGIVASGQKVQQTATAAYLAEVSRREEALARVSAATARAAAADEAVEASRLRAHQALMAQMNRIDSEAAAARAAGNTARGALTPATSQLGATRAAVNASAQQAVVGAVEAEAAAIAKANTAHFAYAQAAGQVAAVQSRLTASSIAMSAAWNGMRSVGGSLIGFLGGPWGAAITAAIVGLGVWEAAQMNSANKERDHKESVESLAGSIKKYQEVVRSGGGRDEQLAAKAKINADLAGTEAAIKDQQAKLVALNFRPQLVDDFGRAVGELPSKIDEISRKLLEMNVPPELVAKLQELAKEAETDKNKADELVRVLNEIGAMGSAFDPVISGALSAASALAKAAGAARVAAGAISAFGALKVDPSLEAIDESKGLNVEKKSLEEANKEAKELLKSRKALREGIEDAKSKEIDDDRGLRIRKEQRNFAGALTADDQRLIEQKVDAEIAAEEAAKARKGRSHKPKKTPEQKQDASISSYEQRADVAMLDRFSQKLVQAAQSAKFSKEEIEKLIATLRSGGELTGLSENMQRLVEAERKLEDAKWARDKIENAKDEAQKYREEVEKLARVMGEGILSDKQKGELRRAVMHDDPAYKQMQQDVDRFMEPIKSDLEKYLSGDHKAFKDFWNQMRATAIKAALDPIWKMVSKLISESLGGALGLGGGGGGGILGALFGGIFGGGGGGGGGGVPLAGLFHSGGTVGAGVPASGFRAVAPGAFAGAMRYHSGLSGGEFPAILQHGERVLTEHQAARTDAAIAGLAAIAGAKRSGGNVEVHNYAAGVQVEPQMTPQGVMIIVKSALEQNNRYLPELLDAQQRRR